jgi:putative transposase
VRTLRVGTTRPGVYARSCTSEGSPFRAPQILHFRVKNFVSAPPTQGQGVARAPRSATAPVTITQTLKSILALSVFKTFPALKQQRFWGSGLWSDGCYYGSAGTVSAATIAKYKEALLALQILRFAKEGYSKCFASAQSISHRISLPTRKRNPNECSYRGAYRTIQGITNQNADPNIGRVASPTGQRPHVYGAIHGETGSKGRMLSMRRDDSIRGRLCRTSVLCAML